MPDASDTHLLPAHRQEQAWNEQRLSEPVQQASYHQWQYDAPALVLGRSQLKLLGEKREGPGGLDVVGRQAGGGAVLVGPWMLSASVALPVDHPLVTRSTEKSYQWLGDLYAAVLADVGVASRVLSPEEAHEQQRHADPALAWACFGGLSPGELVVRNRKLVGFAQVRKRNGVLLVAGVLLAPPDWRLLCRAMGKPDADAAALEHVTTSCEEEAGHTIPAPVLVERLDRALRAALALA